MLLQKNFRTALHHTNIIEYIVNHLTRDNLELKTYGALTIFKVSLTFFSPLNFKTHTLRVFTKTAVNKH